MIAWGDTKREWRCMCYRCVQARRRQRVWPGIVIGWALAILATGMFLWVALPGADVLR